MATITAHRGDHVQLDLGDSGAVTGTLLNDLEGWGGSSRAEILIDGFEAPVTISTNDVPVTVLFDAKLLREDLAAARADTSKRGDF